LVLSGSLTAFSTPLPESFHISRSLPHRRCPRLLAQPATGGHP
jgi:hypothetical protein